MSMIRIGVLSDTHISRDPVVLPARMLAAFAGVNAILHAGDLTCRGVLEALAAIAPVHAVHGNVDPPELERTLPDRLLLEFGGLTIGLTHGHLGRGADTPSSAHAYFHDVKNLAVIVFGHSHQPCNELHRGVLRFNPGSPTQPRQAPWPSYGLLTIEAGSRVRGEIVPLAPRRS